jgi:hypothetical protein
VALVEFRDAGDFKSATGVCGVAWQSVLFFWRPCHALEHVFDSAAVDSQLLGASVGGVDVLAACPRCLLCRWCHWHDRVRCDLLPCVYRALVLCFSAAADSTLPGAYVP